MIVLAQNHGREGTDRRVQAAKQGRYSAPTARALQTLSRPLAGAPAPGVAQEFEDALLEKRRRPLSRNLGAIDISVVQAGSGGGEDKARNLSELAHSHQRYRWKSLLPVGEHAIGKLQEPREFKGAVGRCRDFDDTG